MIDPIFSFLDGNQWIGPVILASGGLITASVAAWVLLRKSSAELRKTARNGVINEWQQITDQLQVQVKEQATQIKDQSAEIKLLRTEITKLYVELATVRTQITARETERVQQRGEIHALEKTVGEIKSSTDTDTLAQAIAPKLADEMKKTT